MSALSRGPGNLQARLQNGIWWDQAPDSVHLNKILDDSIILLIPNNNVTTNGHGHPPDDCLPHEDEAVAAGQTDGGANRVVPASHQAAV